MHFLHRLESMVLILKELIIRSLSVFIFKSFLSPSLEVLVVKY